MTSQPPRASQNHVEGAILRWRRNLPQPQHLVDRADCRDVLRERSDRVDPARGAQPERVVADVVVRDRKRGDSRLGAILLEGAPLGLDSLERTGGPCVFLDEPHLGGKISVEA